MILALDTSGKDLHIGLFDDAAQMLGEFHHIALPTERGVHDSMLAQETAQLLQTLSASVSDIRRIAFVSGPGSFTGLRIGLAFAKGLAFGGAIELVPVIAHSVIKASVSASQQHQSFAGIVSTGYEPTTVYFAEFDSPERVALRPLSELHGPLVGSADLQTKMAAQQIEYTALEFDLSVLARLSLSLPAATDIANLEPFYGTDFKPHRA